MGRQARMWTTLLLAVATLVAAVREVPDDAASEAMIPVAVGAAVNASNVSQQNTSNLCLFNNGGCHDNAICTPSEDGSDVRCVCGPHYTGNGHNCTKRTGCFDGKCGENAHCVEGGLAESVTCACNVGYVDSAKHSVYSKAISKVQLNCIPSQPCRVMNGGCSIHAQCLESSSNPGERSCRCNKGYAGG